MPKMLNALALNVNENKDFGAGLAAAVVVFAVIKFGSKKPSSERRVTQAQLAELRTAIEQVNRELERVKAHVFAVLDEQTALTFAADVFGVSQAVRAWAETGDTTAAKGALAVVEALEYKFAQTLISPPDFLSDETTVVLGSLYIRHAAFRLTIHALNDLENWSDNEAKALDTSTPKISATLLHAQKNIRASAYGFCLGASDSEFEPALGDGEPATSSFTQEYGLSHQQQVCEILGVASWGDYAIDSLTLSRRLLRAQAIEMDKARKNVEDEIQNRAEAMARDDLATAINFLNGLIA